VGAMLTVSDFSGSGRRQLPLVCHVECRDSAERAAADV
jgi:hypothetical protein